MKKRSLILVEHHPASVRSPGQTIRAAVTAWLTKKLYKGV